MQVTEVDWTGTFMLSRGGEALLSDNDSLSDENRWQTAWATNQSQLQPKQP